MALQKWTNRIWVLSLPGEPAFTEEIDALHQQVAREDVVPHLVLDLSGLKQVNSSNLSSLLRVRKLAIDGDAKLRLAAPTDPVWAVLLTTGLDKVFDFSPDVATALAALKMTPPPGTPGTPGSPGIPGSSSHLGRKSADESDDGDGTPRSPATSGDPAPPTE